MTEISLTIRFICLFDINDRVQDNYTNQGQKLYRKVKTNTSEENMRLFTVMKSTKCNSVVLQKVKQDFDTHVNLKW